MSEPMKRVARGAAALLVFVIVVLLMIIGPGLIGGLLALQVAEGMFPVLESGNTNTGNQSLLLLSGPALSAGLIAASLVWDHRVGPKREIVYCAIMFAVTAAASGYNFVGNDELLSPGAQLLLDGVLVVTSGALLLTLFAWQPRRPVARSARIASIFLMTLCGVMLPAFFATMFILIRTGTVSPMTDTGNAVEIVSGLISLAAAAIALRQKMEPASA